jgi:hypothetical protein
LNFSQSCWWKFICSWMWCCIMAYFPSFESIQSFETSVSIYQFKVSCTRKIESSATIFFNTHTHTHTHTYIYIYIYIYRFIYIQFYSKNLLLKHTCTDCCYNTLKAQIVLVELTTPYFSHSSHRKFSNIRVRCAPMHYARIPLNFKHYLQI